MSSDAKLSLYARARQRPAFWVTAPIVIALDQLAKAVAQLTLKPDGWQNGDPSPHYAWIEGVVHGTWALGDSLAFASEGPHWATLVIAVPFWCAVYYLVGFRSGRNQWVMRIGGGTLLGAVLSSLADMLLFGGVRNFMQMGFDNPFASSDHESAYAGLFVLRPLFSPAAVASLFGFTMLIGGTLIGRDPKPIPVSASRSPAPPGPANIRKPAPRQRPQ